MTLDLDTPWVEKFRPRQFDEIVSQNLAINNLNKWIKLEPVYVNGYYHLALANLNKWDMKNARRNFQMVIELAPESEKASLAKKMLENIR